MTRPDFLARNRGSGLDPSEQGLTDHLRRELQLQQIAMSVSIQWGVYPVVLMATIGLWRQMQHLPLLIWCALTASASLTAVFHRWRDRRMLLTSGSAIPDFTQRNAILYAMIGTVWGSLPLLAALFGTVEANWFSMVISLAALASLALILSTTQVVYVAAMLPAGLFILLAIVIGPLPRLELISMTAVYLAVMMLLHKTLFRMQVDRVRASASQAAQAVALVRMLEHHDPLTGLLNRAGLEDWLSNNIDSREDNPQALVVMGTIVGFTELNTLYGAQVADSVLAGVARRLSDASLGALGIARLGGAEFLLVDLRPDTNPDALLQMLAMLEGKPYEALGQSLAIGMRRAWVKGSVREMGALVELTRAQLQSQSDADDSLASLALANRRELVREFHRALINGEIQAWFQPIIDCRTNMLSGWEALARWQHPVHGQLLPPTFLAIARVARQMPELTRMVLRASTRFVHALQKQGHAHAARVHLNITVSELGNPHTLEEIESILADANLAPGAIVVEVTEKDVLIVDEQLTRNLRRMQQIGMPLAIDDFGTGHSNLSRLLDLPADAIKIDKRFIDKLPQDKHSAALVRSIITLGSGLGMKVIAEGVEQPSQLQFLRENGCDACQGFSFSAALAHDAALLFARTWVPASAAGRTLA